MTAARRAISMSPVCRGLPYGAHLIKPARRSGASGAAKRTAILSAKAAAGSYARDSPKVARETLSVLLDGGSTASHLDELCLQGSALWRTPDQAGAKIRGIGGREATACR
jgi:hypothetical protein